MAIVAGKPPGKLPVNRRLRLGSASMLPQEAELELNLRDYLQILRRRKVVVAASLLGVIAVFLTASLLQSPRYAAEAKMLLRPRTAGAVFAPTNSDSTSDRSVRTEIEVIEAQPVRELVRRRVGSAPSVDVRPVGDTDVVTIRAEAADPGRAAAIANAYVESYIELRRRQAIDELSAASEEIQSKIAGLQGQLDSLNSQVAAAPACVDTRTTAEACAQRSNIEQTVASRRTALNSQLGLFQQRLDQVQVDSALTTGGAQVVTPAEAPEEPFAPAPIRSAVLGALLGLMVGIGLAFLLEHLDDSINAMDDLQRAVPGVAVLGLIPAVTDWREPREGRLASAVDPSGPAAEAYRMLRTSIQFLGLDRKVRIVQVTSPNAQEGKTTTLANLAVAFSASGLRTVAVDCDLRRPRLHTFFGVPNDIGFTSVLLGSAALSKALQAVPDQERLLILASGPLPPNPSELLSSQRTAELLLNLSAQADIVLIDSPPALPVTDALVLSQRVDSTFVVTMAGTTTRKAFARTIQMLRQVKAPFIGTVLNGLSADERYGGYSYHYYSAAVTTEGSQSNGRNGERQHTRRGRRRERRR